MTGTSQAGRQRSLAFARGLLFGCAGAPLILTTGALPLDLSGALLGLSVALSLLLAAVAGRRATPLVALGVLVTFGLGGYVGFAQLVDAPLAALAYGVLGIAAVEAALIGDEGHYGESQDDKALLARGGAYGAIGVWSLSIAVDGGPLEAVGLLVATMIATLLAGRWAIAARHSRRLRALSVAVVVGVVCLLTLLGGGSSLAWVLVPIAALVTLPAHPNAGKTPLWALISSHPHRLLVGTFAAMCGLGALALELPIAAADGVNIGAMDALFTAVSAVCVTGLAVLDTGTDFSPTGQLMILLMIQLGGLGIMTFSTVLLRALGQRVSLRHEGAVARLLSHRDRGNLTAVARKLILLTLIAEGLGALCLFVGFLLAGDTPLEAAWRGMFTAISAFCNAGFALQSSSLVPYQGNPWILHTVGALIIAGGIAPIVALLLPPRQRRGAVRGSLHAKLVLLMSGVLLLGGALLFAAFEWDGALAGLPIGDRLHNAWFQSVTLRTAGFNSVELSGVEPETLTVMLAWMLIGGAPGGTAGGIKVTTVAVIGLVVVNAIRGRWGAEAFGRRIPTATIYKALVIAVVAGGGIFLATLCMMLTQAMPTSVAIFEVVSALGTVGLTIGGTAALDGVGQSVIIACMFVGRVGGLSILMLLRDEDPPQLLQRPLEDVDIG